MRIARANPLVLAEMNRHGFTHEQIAEVFGCSHHTIYRTLAAIPKAQRRRLPRAERRPDRALQTARSVIARGRVDHGSAVPLTLAEKRAIPTEVVREVLEANGGDSHAASAVLGIGAKSIRSRVGIVRPQSRPSLSIAEMRSRYEAGASMEAVAADAGIPESNLRRLFKQVGVQSRPSSQVSNELRAARVLSRHEHAVCLLFQAGVPMTVLAEEFDCCTHTIKRVAVANGLERSAPARVSRAQRAVMTDMCRRVRAGRLVVEAGRLVPCELDPRTLSTAQGGDQL